MKKLLNISAIALFLSAMSPSTAIALRKVGNSVTVGKTKFMIWGGAKTGSMPKGASVSHDNKFLYVSNFGRIGKKNVSVYYANPLKFYRYINYKGNSIESLVSKDNKLLYTTNMYGHYFDIIDLKTFKLKKRLKIRGFPKLILLNKKNDKAYISLWSTRSIAVLDLKTFTSSSFRTRQKNPRGLALSSDESKLYVANNGSRTYSVINTASLKVGQKATILHKKIARGPRHAIMSKDGKRLYISVMGSSSILEIDTATLKVKKNIYVGKKPKTIILSSDGKFLYTANYTGHSMSIVNTKTYETKELHLPVVKTSGLVVRPDDKFIYITGWCTDDVWAIQRINPGEAPQKPLGNGYRKFRRRGCRKCRTKFMDCTRIRTKKSK
jgi:YVTN family beta-propeller protein